MRLIAGCVGPWWRRRALASVPPLPLPHPTPRRSPHLVAVQMPVMEKNEAERASIVNGINKSSLLSGSAPHVVPPPSLHAHPETRQSLLRAHTAPPAVPLSLSEEQVNFLVNGFMKVACESGAAHPFPLRTRTHPPLHAH